MFFSAILLSYRCTVIGKAEGVNLEWHGHVTALTVAPEYRRLGLARKMMNLLEMVSDESYKGFFVDLYVRCANLVAIDMYEGLGYSVYRRVREYYGNLGVGKGGRDEEDAFGVLILLVLGKRLMIMHRYEETAFSRYRPTFGTG